MQLKTLSNYEAKIIAAMGRGVIPRGGNQFKTGASDLEDKWLPRTDYMLSRMPFINRIGFKMALHLLNWLWPILFLRKLTPLIKMDETVLVRLSQHVEDSPFPFSATVLLAKLLVFPAFYGLAEVKTEIGYQEKFPVKETFVEMKD